MEPEALGREMLADHRHVEVGAVTPAHRGGQPVAVPACRVRSSPHLGELGFPLGPGQAAVVEVRPGPFPPVVEELGVLRFEWIYLALDEVVQFGEERRQVVWQLEVHGARVPF